MKHDCKYIDEDGLNYFKEAIIDDFIEYDDWWDAYIITYCREKPFLFFFKKRWLVADILTYCPYCGKKIYNEPKVKGNK